MEQNRQVIITRWPKETQKGILTALTEEGRAVELSLEPAKNPSLLGNIYIGKVKNLAPQIGAAFVEIGEGQICYFSLQENPSPLLVNRLNPNTKKPLVPGDELIVQVCREALKTKAPAVTCNLNFPGKYLVLTSQNRKIGISGKLDSDSRERLLRLLTPLRDGTYGLIARTNARDAGEEVLKKELDRLEKTWKSVLEKGKSRTCFSLLYQEEPPFLSALRSAREGTLSRILTDDPKLWEQIREYLLAFQPEDLNKLGLYEDRQLPLHKLYSLEKALEEALRERVWLKSGGYLVIQPTEALTVVDVNTGKYEGGKKKQQTYRKINREAALETARQLRLRNLSGIIIIDFIDMESEEDQEDLLTLLAEELKKDPVKALVMDMTRLHLVELTRKKLRKSLAEQWQELQNSPESAKINSRENE